MTDGDDEISHQAVLAARSSYSRLVAYLASRTGDVAGAEDALGDAFRAALETWPARGVPDKPEAWLLTAARNRLADAARHQSVRSAAAATLKTLSGEAVERAAETSFPDERLKLLFICAHPAIDRAARTPLMLQTVLGLNAARIGSAFLVAPAAMGRRLVRAKAKIRDARIAFAVPDYGELPERLDAVLDAIYAAYGTGWEDAAGADPRRRGLADEAIWLARLVTQLLPDEAEAHGLLALMLFCEARRPARRSVDGGYVALSDQDVELWDAAMIDDAKQALGIAASYERLGRYQLEAAIQSLHARRREGQPVNWRAIADLYTSLVTLAPTVGALTGRAAAIVEADGVPAGLAALDAIDGGRVSAYQPYWAVRADVLGKLGRVAEAQDAYTRALGLTEDGVVRAYLQKRAAQHDG